MDDALSALGAFPSGARGTVIGEGIFDNAGALLAVKWLERLAGLDVLAATNPSLDGYDSTHYTLVASRCSSPQAAILVRRHLDSGVLHKLTAKFIANFINPISPADFTCHGYLPVIFGACAMSLGCVTLTTAPGYKVFFPTFMDFLGSVHETAPLMDFAKLQMRAALDSSRGYKPGARYNFITTDIVATNIAFTPAPINDKDQTMFGGKTANYKSKLASPKGKAMSQIGPCEKGDMGYSTEFVCGACGKNNGKLVMCGNCKHQAYCGKECQRKDFRGHKPVCRKPADAEALKLHAEAFINDFYVPFEGNPGLGGTEVGMKFGQGLFPGK